MPGVDALHICGGVRLGIAQSLGLLQGLAVAQPQAGHGVQNVIAGAVHNAAHMVNGLNAPGPLQLGKPADAAAHRGGAAQEDAPLPGQGNQLVKAGGDESLVGGGHVLARQNGAADILIGRMEPADGLHHRINMGVIQNIFKVMGYNSVRQLQIPAAQHPGNGHVLPPCDDLIYAPAHGAEAQKSYLHLFLSPLVGGTLFTNCDFFFFICLCGKNTCFFLNVSISYTYKKCN